MLRGGLGNVLFQLSATKAFHLDQSIGAELITTFTTLFNESTPTANFTRQLANSFAFNLCNASSTFHTVVLLCERITGGKVITDSNFADTLKMLKTNAGNLNNKSLLLSGYFQNSEVFRTELEAVGKSATSILNATFGSFHGKDFIAIHVRLGDYLKFPRVYGELDAGYFEKALVELEAKIGKIPTAAIVFSDSPEAAAALLQGSLTRFESVEFSEKDPLQDLWLMSQAVAIVGSNSTFSWWASRLNTKKPITYPDPFLVNRRANQKIQLFNDMEIEVRR